MKNALKSIPWWGWTLFALFILYMMYQQGVFKGISVASK